MARKRLKKEERLRIYRKFGGRCAYCGQEIAYADMQVDHIVPIWKGGEDTPENMFPACRSCNHYKRGESLESFRKAIETIPHKLNRDSYIYRVGCRYGNVKPDEKKIIFCFEEQ